MKTTRKKIFALFLATALTVGCCGLTACKNKKPDDGGNGDNPPPVTPIDPVPTKKTADEIIGELLVDDYASSGYTPTGAENPRYVQEWEALKAKKQPLAIGDSYTETFEKSFVEGRLYPENTVNGAAVQFLDAEEGGIGSSGKNLRITTNGAADGANDAVLFKGMQIVSGARYRLTLTAKTDASASSYFVGFRGSQGDVYAFNFSGTDGQTQTVTGVVSLSNNDYEGVVLTVGGSAQTASELVIDDLKLERLEPLPVLDLRQIGSKTHKIDFEESADYVTANNSAIERTTEGAIEGYSLKISKTAAWQGLDFTGMKLAAGGTYRVRFDAKLIGANGAGMAFATMSSAANGSYQDIGQAIGLTSEVTAFNLVYTLKDFDDYFLNFSISSANCVFMLDNIVIECIEPPSRLDVTETGAKYEQNFDHVTLDEVKECFVGSNSALALIDRADGKALQITKTGSWNGLSLNLDFASEGTYKIKFDIQVTQNHDWDWGNFFVTLKDGALSQNIGSQLFVSADNVVPKDGVVSIELDFDLTGDDYALTISNYGGNTVYWIDNFAVERIA